MNEMRQMLLPGGFLVLAVPVGRDAVVWNAHRVYGRVRLPFLLKGWELVHTIGLEEDTLDTDVENPPQPICVLRRGGCHDVEDRKNDLQQKE